MNQQKTNLTACLVGLGWWGRHLLSEASDSAVLKITSCVDPSPEALEFAKTRGLQHFKTLADALAGGVFDAVIIATPHSMHRDQCLQALEAGKAVFCEKPLALTAGDARRITEEAAARGSVLGVGHERRFEPGFERIAELIAGGTLGRIISVDANVSHNLMLRAKPGDWRLNAKEAPAGLWTGTGVHISDLIIASCGTPTDARVELLSSSTNFSGEEFVRVDLQLSTGVHATVTTLACTPYYGRYTVFGDQGWVELVTLANVDGGQEAILTIAGSGGARATERIAPTRAVQANLEEWAKAVLGRATYRITADQIVFNTAVLQAIATSMGRPAGYVGVAAA